jgi:hypothetical protein
MAEIDDQDLISRRALEAPGKLADQLDRVYQALNRIFEAAKKSEASIASAKTTNKVSKETENLRKTQKRLSEEQEKAAKIAKVLWLSQNEVAEAQKRASQTGKQMGSVVSDLEKKMAQAANTATAYGKAQKESNTQSQQATQIYKAEAGSLEALTQKRIQLRGAIESQKKNQKEDIDLLRRGIISRAEFNKRMAESEGVIARNSAGIQNLNTAIKNHLITTSSISGEYKRLTTQLEQARTKYKDLAASGSATTRVLEQQRRIVVDLNNKVMAIDKSVGQFQRNVGNYPQTFNAAAAALTRFVGAFGLVTGLALFAKSLKDIISLTTEFEYKNDTLQAVLGATKEEIAALTDQQLKYGESTIYSALQVADLQIIFSKLGLTTAEIREATEATLDLATATGEDLAKSADVLGTIMRSFGLAADQTTRIVDVMTGAFNKTTLGLENFFEAMKYVAPIAKANNITLEETTALLGTLADAGIRGSMAGTSLRKIISELDKGSGTLSEKLKKLAAGGFGSANAMDEVGRTAYASLLILTQNTDQTDKLNTALHDVGGSAKEAARIMGDNLRGDALLAGNAMEALSLDLREELTPALRSIVQSFTAFIFALRELPRFLKENQGLLVSLTLALIAFRGASIAASAAELRRIAMLKLAIIWEKAATITTRGLTAGIYAMLGPLGLVVLAFSAAGAAIAIYDSNSQRANDVAKQTSKLNEGLANQTENVTKAQKTLNVSIEDWLKMNESQRRSVAEQIEFTVNHSKAMLARLKIQREELAQTAQQLTLWQRVKVGVVGALSPVAAIVDQARYSVENMNDATAEADENIKKLEVEIDGLTHVLDDNNEALKTNTKLQTEADKKRALDAAKAAIDLEKFRLELQIKSLEEIQNNENESMRVRVASTEKLEKLRTQVAGLERKRALLEEIKNNAERTLIEERYQAAVTEITKRGYKDRDAIRKFELEQEIELAESNAKIVTERILAEADRRSDAIVMAIQREVLAGRMSREQGDKEILKQQQKANKELIELSIQSLEQQLANERHIYYEERRKLIESSNLNAVDKAAELVEVDRERAEEETEIEQKLHDLRVKLQNSAYNNQVGKWDEEIAALQNVQGIYESWAASIGGLFDALTQQRIAGIDAELRRLQESTDKQIELAGDNDDAKKDIERKAEARRKELEKKRVDDLRRFAKYEKATGIVSATVKGVLAVLNQLSTGDPYTAYARAAAAGIAAAVEIATIVATPIPQYAKGVQMGVHPGGLAVVGEQGSERVRTQSGHTFYTPNKATMMEIPAGAEVTPHRETMRDLALSGLMRGAAGDSQSGYDPRLHGELREIKKAIVNNKPARVNIIREASTVWEGIEAREGFVSYFRGLAISKKRKK